MKRDGDNRKRMSLMRWFIIRLPSAIRGNQDSLEASAKAGMSTWADKFKEPDDGDEEKKQTT